MPSFTSADGLSWSMRRAAVEDLALGDVAALGAQQVGDRLEGGGLARAVGAEQRHDLAVLHLERDALQHQDHVVVDHLDVLQREDRGLAHGMKTAARRRPLVVRFPIFPWSSRAR